MLWFLLWAFLVLAAIVVYVLIGRDLWIKAKALLGQVEESSQLVGDIMDRIEEETPAQPRRTPALQATREEIYADVRQQRKRREARKKVKQQRHAQTFEGWSVLRGTTEGDVRSARPHRGEN